MINKDNGENLWIIDTDFSDDDKLALEILLPNLNVVAITVVGTIDQSPSSIKKEVEAFLKLKNLDIKVYAGADRAFVNYQKELGDEKIHCAYHFIENRIKSDDIQEGSIPTKIEDIKKKINDIASVKILDIS